MVVSGLSAVDGEGTTVVFSGLSVVEGKGTTVVVCGLSVVGTTVIVSGPSVAEGEETIVVISELSVVEGKGIVVGTVLVCGFSVMDGEETTVGTVLVCGLSVVLKPSTIVEGDGVDVIVIKPSVAITAEVGVSGVKEIPVASRQGASAADPNSSQFASAGQLKLPSSSRDSQPRRTSSHTCRQGGTTVPEMEDKGVLRDMARASNLCNFRKVFVLRKFAVFEMRSQRRENSAGSLPFDVQGGK